MAVLEAALVETFIWSEVSGRWAREAYSTRLFVLYRPENCYRVVTDETARPNGKFNAPVYDGMACVRTGRFVQWRDRRNTYLVGFPNEEACIIFVNVMLKIGAREPKKLTKQELEEEERNKSKLLVDSASNLLLAEPVKKAKAHDATSDMVATLLKAVEEPGEREASLSEEPTLRTLAVSVDPSNDQEVEATSSLEKTSEILDWKGLDESKNQESLSKTSTRASAAAASVHQPYSRASVLLDVSSFALDGAEIDRIQIADELERRQIEEFVNESSGALKSSDDSSASNNAYVDEKPHFSASAVAALMNSEQSTDETPRASAEELTRRSAGEREPSAAAAAAATLASVPSSTPSGDALPPPSLPPSAAAGGATKAKKLVKKKVVRKGGKKSKASPSKNAAKLPKAPLPPVPFSSPITSPRDDDLTSSDSDDAVMPESGGALVRMSPEELATEDIICETLTSEEALAVASGVFDVAKLRFYSALVQFRAAVKDPVRRRALCMSILETFVLPSSSYYIEVSPPVRNALMLAHATLLAFYDGKTQSKPRIEPTLFERMAAEVRASVRKTVIMHAEQVERAEGTAKRMLSESSGVGEQKLVDQYTTTEQLIMRSRDHLRDATLRFQVPRPKTTEDVKKHINEAVAQWMDAGQGTMRRVITLAMDEKKPKSVSVLRSLARLDDRVDAWETLERPKRRPDASLELREVFVTDHSDPESSEFVDIDGDGIRAVSAAPVRRKASSTMSQNDDEKDDEYESESFSLSVVGRNPTLEEEQRAIAELMALK